MADSQVAGASYWFDLRGGLLRVWAPEVLLEPLLTYLRPLRCGPGAACFELNLEAGVPERPPDDMVFTFQGTLPEGGIGTQWTAPGRRWLTVDGRLSAAVDEAARRARIVVTADGTRWIGASAGIMCLDAALRSTGQALVHAAAFLPSRHAEASLLCGPSGRGKTTTTLALALHGFSVLTDDASVLAFNGGKPHVWGLPRPMKLHRHSLELLPALRPALGADWNVDDEQAVDPDRLRHVIDLRAPEPMPVANIIWVGERVAGAHLLRPIARGDMMALLARDNARLGPLGVAEDSLHRFTALARTVAACRVYELRVGSDLPALAPFLASGLA